MVDVTVAVQQFGILCFIRAAGDTTVDHTGTAPVC